MSGASPLQGALEAFEASTRELAAVLDSSDAGALEEAAARQAACFEVVRRRLEAGEESPLPAALEGTRHAALGAAIRWRDQLRGEIEDLRASGPARGAALPTARFVSRRV